MRPHPRLEPGRTCVYAAAAADRVWRSVMARECAASAAAGHRARGSPSVPHSASSSSRSAKPCSSMSAVWLPTWLDTGIVDRLREQLRHPGDRRDPRLRSGDSRSGAGELARPDRRAEPSERRRPMAQATRPRAAETAAPRGARPARGRAETPPRQSSAVGVLYSLPAGPAASGGLAGRHRHDTGEQLRGAPGRMRGPAKATAQIGGLSCLHGAIQEPKGQQTDLWLQTRVIGTAGAPTGSAGALRTG